MIDIAVLLPSIESIVNEELAKSHVPGIVVGLVNGDGLVFGKGYGLADIEKNTPMTTRTVMRWGSISKLFTCIGVFQQWERGQFQLADPVNKYLKRGKIVPKRKDWPEVTFEHLLTHTAGIGEIRRGADLLVKGFRLLTYDDKPVPALSSLHDLDLPLSAPPGSKYAYSNIGGSLLGFLTEIFSGKDFQRYMIDNVFTPLGMDDSDFAWKTRSTAPHARGYKYEKGKLRPARIWNNIITPSGGLAATLEDMAKFASCLIKKGKHDSGQLLDPKTFDLLWTPHYWAHNSFKDCDSLGYIFRLQRLNGERIVWHTGGLSGFTSTFDILPDEGIGLITSANLSETLSSRITLRLRHRILKVICGAENRFDPVAFAPDKSWWPDMKGYYGGQPGWLSNTRVIALGLDFKVSEKEGHLILSSLFGVHKKGTKLYPTADPLVYEYPVDDGADIDYVSRIGFIPGEQQGKIAGLAIGDQNTLRKNTLVNTFRFKMLVIVILIAVTITLIAALDAIDFT
ncbi:MAG: serine hydrolase domain-containing protein [Candidatus Sigynarchaeota archaeon]